MLTDDVLQNEPTPEANRYGVGSASCLKLRQQVADVRLDGLLREEEPLADLAVHEPVGDELENLDLAGGRILSDLARGRRSERDDRTAARRAAPRSGGLEPAAVVAVPVQDLSALSSVHVSGIGATRRTPLDPRSRLARTGERTRRPHRRRRQPHAIRSRRLRYRVSA